MDNKRDVESGAARIGEIVDGQTGTVEESIFSATEKEINTPEEKKYEIEKEIPTEALPEITSDDLNIKRADSELAPVSVNFTTRDGESIERENMKKVDKLMERTKNDPWRRQNDFFAMKQATMKGRFNRVIGEKEVV